MHGNVRRLLVMLFVLAQIAGLLTCASAGGQAPAGYGQEMRLIQALGIWPQALEQKGPHAPVSRGELALALTGMMGLGEGTPPDRFIFSDIPESHPAKNAAELAARLGLMTGEGAGFSPDREALVGELSRGMLAVLGYRTEEDPFLLGMREGLFKGVPMGSEAVVSASRLAKIMGNALTLPMMAERAKGDARVLVKSGTNGVPLTTPLGKYLHTQKYKAVVRSVSPLRRTMRVQILRAGSAEEAMSHKKGDILTVGTERVGDVSEFSGMNVELYLHTGGQAVYCALSKNQNVFYGTISAVNGDTEQNAYYGGLLTSVEVDGEVLYTAGGFALTYNGRSALEERNVFAKRLARFVLSENEIVSLQVFDLQEGGLVTAAANEKILFTQGMGKNKLIDELDAFQTVTVLIDQSPAAASDLQAGMLMDYWISPDGSVLLVSASTYRISDRITSVSHDEVFIGEVSYPVSVLFEAYFSDKTGVFTGRNEPVNALGQYGQIWLDNSGGVRYVRVEPGSSDAVNQSFYGFVAGVSAKGLQPSVHLYRLDGGVIERKTLRIAGNASIEGGMAELSADAAQRNDRCLWIFKTNAKGEVKEAVRPEARRTVHKITVNRIYVDAGKKTMAFETGGNSRALGNVPVNGAAFVGLVETGGAFRAVSAQLGDFGPEVFTVNGSCVIYKEPLKPNADLVLFWHDAYPDSFFTSYTYESAVITSLQRTLDSEGEEQYKAELVKRGGEKQTRTFSLETGEKLLPNALFAYRERVMFSVDSLMLSPAAEGYDVGRGNHLMVDLSNPLLYENATDITAFIDQCEQSGSYVFPVRKERIFKGVIYKTEGDSVWFSDQDKYAFQIPGVSVFELGAGDRIRYIDSAGLQSGSMVYFYLEARGNIDFIITRP